MKSLFVSSFLLLAFFISGCAIQVQEPISLKHSSVPEGTRVGVLVQAVPEPSISYPGAGCLLCLAAASAAHGDLSKHVKTLSTDELQDLHLIVTEELEKNGFVPAVIDKQIDISKYPKVKSKVPNTVNHNFSSLKKDYNIDQLLVLELFYVGVQRNYSSYVPTADPQAVVRGRIYIADLATNLYSLYQTVDAYKAAEGEWKEPPSFPGLTNAYYQVLEQVRDNIRSSLSLSPETLSTDSSEPTAN